MRTVAEWYLSILKQLLCRHQLLDTCVRVAVVTVMLTSTAVKPAATQLSYFKK